MDLWYGATILKQALPETVSDICFLSDRLALAGSIASSAAYVTGKLAALVGQASYATALAIAKSLPGHKKKKKTGELVTAEVRQCKHQWQPRRDSPDVLKVRHLDSTLHAGSMQP